MGVRFVSDFCALAEQSFSGNINALCWERQLPGDFNEIVGLLENRRTEGLITLDESLLQTLPLSAAGRIAADVMLADLRWLSERQLAPVLNCIFAYPHDERTGPVSTDVFSFHVDSAPCETDTWLCTYHGPASEGLCNREARWHIDIPATRAALLASYGGSDDLGFQDYLSDNAYDLHYAAPPGALPYSFGTGNLWRIATQHPGCAVLPSIHRAPPTQPGDPPRLMLIC